MYSENQLTSLRKLYRKTLWAYIGVSAMAPAAAFLLSYIHAFPSEQLIPRLVGAGVGLILAAVDYTVERALLKKGKRTGFLSVVFLLVPMILCVILAETNVYEKSVALVFPLFFSFMFSHSCIPAIVLLSDRHRLGDGDPCETVGRIKPGTRRDDTEVGRDTYLLFEDELTHEAHLLRMGSVSPLQRYRVLYLPHSGLAVGEIIPDHITFDPFGNPIEREAEDTRQTAEKPDCTEESCTVKPAYTEDEPTEKPWYQNPEAFSNEPPKAEPKEPDTDPDHHSPERKRAAKYAVASKVCKVLTFVFFGGIFLGALMARDNISPGAMLLTIPFFVVSIVLGEVFKSKELKLRCTKRTTAYCVDTVRRRSGKHSHRYPIVQFEADGVTHTVELTVSCSRDSVGDLYTLYYDPLDPDTVRPERRGLFD